MDKTVHKLLNQQINKEFYSALNDPTQFEQVDET